MFHVLGDDVVGSDGRGAARPAGRYRHELVPAGEIAPVEKLRAGLERALQAHEVQQRLLAESSAPQPSTPEELAAFIRSEIEKWGSAVKASEAKVD